MSKHPEVLWAQRSSDSDKEKNVVIVTINLPNIDVSSLKYDLKPTALSFTAQAGAGNPSTYEFSIDLYKEVIPEESLSRLTSRDFLVTLRKKDVELEFWPRLTRDKVKNAFIKTDFSKWVDEDEQEDAGGASFDDDTGGMGGMGGMPGMGGMGGMPGMGNMGGFGGPGGGMDFEKMMADMKNSGPLPGDAEAEAVEAEEAADGGSDSESDVNTPPPLEEVAAE